MSPDLLPFIRDWRVAEEMESLSDHLYIAFTISTNRPHLPVGRLAQRRWNLDKFNDDLFLAVLIWKGHTPEVEDQSDVTQLANWLDRLLEEACDAAAPRIGPRKPRRNAY